MKNVNTHSDLVNANEWAPMEPKDISQQHVVRDDTYEEVVQTLRDVVSGKIKPIED